MHQARGRFFHTTNKLPNRSTHRQPQSAIRKETDLRDSNIGRFKGGSTMTYIFQILPALLS
ncbi:MAG: hypothetical protein ACLS4D_12350, partial [Lacticaseibacillus rhamnosus]